MRSIDGGIGRARGAPVHGSPPAARVPSSRQSAAPPAETPFRVLAVVKDRATGRPVGDASYDVVKRGQEGTVLAAGTTGFQGTIDAPVASGGEYLVRVKAVGGQPGPQGKPLSVGPVGARGATAKAVPTAVLVAPQRAGAGATRPNPKNRKPAAAPKKDTGDDEKTLKNLQLAWGK